MAAVLRRGIVAEVRLSFEGYSPTCEGLGESPKMSKQAVPVHEKYPGTGFVILCLDGPNGEQARAVATADHLKYIETVMHEVNVAGPLYDPAGMRVIGSLYILATTNEARAHELIENDPYYQAGAFGEIRYQPFLPAAGRYIGGKIW